MISASPLIDPMTLAAQAGGKVLTRYFGESLETIRKSTAADFKTKADIESEFAIFEILTAEFPDYNILSEEKGMIDRGSEFTFVVDPLDGTNNFVIGIPNFTVSIGLMRRDKIIAGLIYSPILHRTYFAEKEKGAFLDTEKIQVNSESRLRSATVNHICGYESDFDQEIRLIHSLYAQKVKRVSSNWSAAFDFCMLATGRVEAVINSESELHDFAAGKLIAMEAGALITDLAGDPESSDKNRHFIASNGTEIHTQLVELIRNSTRLF